MKPFQPNICYIEQAALNHPKTLSILQKLQGVEIQIVEDYKNLGLVHLPTNPRFKQEKTGLILAYKKGELVKQVQRDLFREIPNEYYIIHSLGCPSDCQYCFLFDYLTHQMPTLFVNQDEILESVQTVIESRADESLTFHAGEFSDALAYDHLTEFSKSLVELFSRYDHARLELRTKSDTIKNLIGLKHKGKTIVSWTFSPQRVVQLFEYQTATADERIEAAYACQKAGYPVALRFDPIIRYPDWESGYQQLIERMAERLNSNLIFDCQLGVFRYTPGLWKVIRERFPRSWLGLQESVPSQDGKYRYLKPLRIEMYRKIIGWLRAYFPNLKIELCMDSPEVEELVSNTIDN
jgi:spore photoproduct lyase